jgi:Domain of unknown function (DUF222)/HNH endonuclease
MYKTSPVTDKPVISIGAASCPTDDPKLMPMEHLEARICELAGHLTAGTCEFLRLIADFDAREGWTSWEMPSCAAWLSWKCQLAPGTAREHVRVARALVSLPVIRGEFAAGRFSYAKVRALTRIATPETERDLADMAECMTAGQVERFARAHRRVSHADDQAARASRKLTWRYDEDGTISISVRLPGEEGAVVQQALRAFLDDLDHPHDGEPRDRNHGLADALAGICAAYLQGKIADADNADVYQVIIHAGADAITPDKPARVSAETPRPGWPIWHPAWLDRCHVEDGPAISPATLQLIGCNATISTMVHDADGSVLSVGRRSRKAPPALRRAVRERDGYRCRFPGCHSRKTDLHHIRYWSNGGETSLENLLLLCRRHHTLVHEDGYIITPGGGGFYNPDGRPLPGCPPLPCGDGDITAAHDAEIEYHTIVPPHSGERLNLHEAIWIAFANASL